MIILFPGGKLDRKGKQSAAMFIIQMIKVSIICSQTAQNQTRFEFQPELFTKHLHSSGKGLDSAPQTPSSFFGTRKIRRLSQEN